MKKNEGNPLLTDKSKRITKGSPSDRSNQKLEGNLKHQE